MTPSMTACPPTWARRTVWAQRAAPQRAAPSSAARGTLTWSLRVFGAVDRGGVVRPAAGHLALGAGAVQAARAALVKERRRNDLDHAAHLPCQCPDLPLGTIAAAHGKEVAQLAGVHGDDDLGLGGVGQHETRVFLDRLATAAGGETQLDELVVGL